MSLCMISCIMYHTSWIIHHTSCTMHYAPYIHTSYTHHTPCTMHHTPCTIHTYIIHTSYIHHTSCTMHHTYIIHTSCTMHHITYLPIFFIRCLLCITAIFFCLSLLNFIQHCKNVLNSESIVSRSTQSNHRF